MLNTSVLLAKTGTVQDQSVIQSINPPITSWDAGSSRMLFW